MILLKQSTAATLRVGPFMDLADGVTPETGVTLAACDQAEILKASGATVDITAATWAAITGVDGWYDLSISTSHSDTLGMLTVVVQDASVFLPVFVRAMVVPAVVWDSLIGGTDTLTVDVTQWTGTAVATPDTAGFVKATIKDGTGQGELNITSGVVEANVASMTANTLTASALAADAVTEIQSGLATAAALTTIDDFLDTEIAAILADTNELQTDWANGGRLDLLLDATLADTNELQTDLVNGGRLDLLIDGIKNKTDSLTFTQSGHVDANVQRINDVAITGDGGVTPFGV